MTEKILIVDDEQNVLNGISRSLRKEFNIDTALSGKAALEAITRDGPYAVIVSDLRMPEMDGIRLLNRVKDCAPDTVRMMLTGNADLKDAMQAVNEGNIFRFFTKPCPLETFTKGIQIGIEQYRLVTAERELLEKTLKGSIKVMTELLSIVNPEAFGRSSRLERYVKQIASQLNVSEPWQFELAALLSQVGCITLPEAALKKLYLGQSLSEDELQLFEKHPSIASNLLSHIPRLQKVAEIIQYQEKHFDGSGIPEDDRRGENIPLGSRILKVALDFDVLEQKKNSTSHALHILKERNGRYDPVILQAMEKALKAEDSYAVKEISVSGLRPDMILEKDVFTKNGQLLISRGQEVNSMLISRLQTFSRNVGVQEPLCVRIPF
jgi:response regulator RpfG family c-di-GMP phosphodiesterase